ncbi:hypothetical protein C0J56_24480 [Pseudomonas fluorescens]|nr:hypothetical protein C0J56_24480 [Pseudomonas fluorescens]
MDRRRTGQCHREQARSHRFAVFTGIVSSANPLARDSGGSACIDVECADAIASRLAPTIFCGVHRIVSTTNPLWERACSR